MINIGKLCLNTDFDYRIIREEDNDIDLFIDINYRSLDIDTCEDSFFNSRVQFPYVRSLILRINKESNVMTVHLMRDIDQSDSLLFQHPHHLKELVDLLHCQGRSRLIQNNYF